MPCDHIGGPELIEMAEQHLRCESVPEERWPGLRFRWAENLADGMWASAVVEIERRGDRWVVVRLDRNRQALDTADVGFRALGA